MYKSPVPTPKTSAPTQFQPKWLFVHCRTSPCISSGSPPLKPQSPPSSQPKWLFVHCRTSPCISPQSPPLKHQSPPSSQPKWLFVHCRTSPCTSPQSQPLKPQSPPSSQPKWLFVHCRTSFVHCRTSPCISPQSPPLKPQPPPVPNLNGCLFNWQLILGASDLFSWAQVSPGPLDLWHDRLQACHVVSSSLVWALFLGQPTGEATIQPRVKTGSASKQHSSTRECKVAGSSVFATSTYSVGIHKPFLWGVTLTNYKVANSFNQETRLPRFAQQRPELKMYVTRGTFPSGHSWFGG